MLPGFIEKTDNVLTIQLEHTDVKPTRIETVNVLVDNYRDALEKYRKYKPSIGWRKVGYSYSGRL